VSGQPYVQSGVAIGHYLTICSGPTLFILSHFQGKDYVIAYLDFRQAEMDYKMDYKMDYELGYKLDRRFNVLEISSSGQQHDFIKGETSKGLPG
jgi:hypothetical protein